MKKGNLRNLGLPPPYRLGLCAPRAWRAFSQQPHPRSVQSPCACPRLPSSPGQTANHGQ